MIADSAYRKVILAEQDRDRTLSETCAILLNDREVEPVDRVKGGAWVLTWHYVSDEDAEAAAG